MRQTLIGSFFVLSSCAANGAQWMTVSPGEPLPDTQIDIGRFVIQLPPGSWHVLAKSSNRVSGFPGTAPVLLSVALAQVENGKLVGTLAITTPASSYARVIWTARPCQEDTTLWASKDGATFQYPECLHIGKATPRTTWTALDPTAYLARAAKALEAMTVPLPDRAFEVSYAKMYRGDSLRITTMIPGNPDGPLPPAFETWGRAVRATVRIAVMGDSTAVSIPPLPRP